MGKWIAVAVLIVVGNILVIFLLQQQPSDRECMEKRITPHFIGKSIIFLPICAKWKEGE